MVFPVWLSQNVSQTIHQWFPKFNFYLCAFPRNSRLLIKRKNTSTNDDIFSACTVPYFKMRLSLNRNVKFVDKKSVCDMPFLCCYLRKGLPNYPDWHFLKLEVWLTSYYMACRMIQQNQNTLEYRIQDSHGINDSVCKIIINEKDSHGI